MDREAEALRNWRQRVAISGMQPFGTSIERKPLGGNRIHPTADPVACFEHHERDRARFAQPPRSNRRIIDISGDGTNNSGRLVTEARDQAIAEGVTINGLAIVNDKPNPGYAFHTQPPGGLPEWYRQNVIGGPGAFLRVVDDFHSFSDAMTNKLVSEIVVQAREERSAGLR